MKLNQCNWISILSFKDQKNNNNFIRMYKRFFYKLCFHPQVHVVDYCGYTYNGFLSLKFRLRYVIGLFVSLENYRSFFVNQNFV